MSFPYGKYKNSRNAAWQCLLDNRINALPVPVFDIARQNGIRTGTYAENVGFLRRHRLESLTEQDGFSLRVGNRFLILFRDGMSPGRTRFTVAHELGHIFLGHLFPTVERDGTLEHQANVFASRLLAPACVLWGLGLHTAEEIAAAVNAEVVGVIGRTFVLYRRNPKDPVIDLPRA